MVAVGTRFPLLSSVGPMIRKRLPDARGYVWVMRLAIPLPHIVIDMGWMLAEIGRQPWIGHRFWKTANAASQVWTSLVGFILVYGLLGIAGFYMIAEHATPRPAAGCRRWLRVTDTFEFTHPACMHA